MAYSEPAVRHAVIALGYLNKMESGSLKHARSEFQVVHGSKTLLFHYNKAVRCLVDRMAEASYLPEIGLVTCLLFVCIEYLRANYHTAFTHMTNGLRVISDWQRQRRVDTPFEDSSPSTGSNLIEDTILPMFLRCMTSAQLYGVKPEDHFEMPFPDPHSFIQDPFTLQEAERSSRELRNASVLLLRQIGFSIGHNMAVEMEHLEQQAQLLACHREWFHRVKIVEDSQHWPPADRISLSTLKIALYATQTYVACCASAQQLPSDEHLDTFKTLIHEAEIVLDAMEISNKHAARFTFEMSIIPPLYHTAARCRCPVTRRKAISLLSRGPPREGLWDAEQQVLVLKRVIEYEESELDPETGWPVERTRLASCVIDANMDVNGGFWIYLTPSEWVGQVDASGKLRLLQERLHM
ncbi:hypothetical protein N0V94_001731 [Neodidymelliopsis sp. IMI 364377]|nr:hypothetical protein N0V94_001731 [Neodidymelliopsis sp. IMI 364377]